MDYTTLYFLTFVVVYRDYNAGSWQVHEALKSQKWTYINGSQKWVYIEPLAETVWNQKTSGCGAQTKGPIDWK